MFFDPHQTLTDLGIPHPPEVAAATEMSNVLRAMSFGADQRPVPNPRTSTPETLKDDMRAHLADVGMRALAQDLVRNFESHARDTIRDVYFRAAPTLIPDITKRAGKHLKIITDAARHIGPDDTAETVLERDKAAIDTWRNRDTLDDARGVLDAATQVLRMLGELVRTIPTNTPEHDLLWIVDADDHNHLARLTAEFHRADCPGSHYLALAHAGHTLAVATPDEFMARVHTIESAAEAEATFEQRKAQAREQARNRDFGERMVETHQRLMVRE